MIANLMRVMVPGSAVLALSVALAGCGSTPTTGCNGALCRKPQAEFLYAASFSNSSIESFTVDLGTGALGFPTSVAGPGGPGEVVATPTGSFLYVSDNQTDAIDAFSINATNGDLTPISGSPFSVAGFPPLAASGLAIDRQGKFLYVTEFGSGTLAGFTINGSTGALAAVVGSPFLTGTNPVLAAIDPSGKFIYVSNLNDPNGSISAFTIDSTSGSLSPIPGSPFPTVPNGGPQFLVAHPGGKYLYVDLSGADAVAAFSIGANGALSPVAGSPFSTGHFPLGVAVDPVGKSLFVANNGDGTISAFEIDPNTGALTVVAGSPFSAGTNQFGLSRCPYALLVDSGRFLYSGDGCNSAMLSFSIAANGALSSPSVTTSVGSPLYLALANVP